MKKKLPSDFNWKRYVDLNKDIGHIKNENDAVTHYLNHGINENRVYKYKIPRDFNWKTYIFYVIPNTIIIIITIKNIQPT